MPLPALVVVESDYAADWSRVADLGRVEVVSAFLDPDAVLAALGRLLDLCWCDADPTLEGKPRFQMADADRNGKGDGRSCLPPPATLQQRYRVAPFLPKERLGETRAVRFAGSGLQERSQVVVVGQLRGVEAGFVEFAGDAAEGGDADAIANSRFVADRPVEFDLESVGEGVRKGGQ